MAKPAHGDLAARLRALADRLEREAARGALASLVEALEALLADRGGDEPGLSGADSGGAESGVAKARAAGEPGAAQIWSDGSCAPNPGPGGWAAIVEQDGARQELSGAAPASTNNIMEMTAAIEGLRRVPPGRAVVVTSDSRYLVDGMTRWLSGWKRRGWRKADGEPVLNRELWMALDELARARQVRWEWVRGHVGHAENERCDQLANAARERLAAEPRR